MKRRFAICLILSIFTAIIALGSNTYASVNDFVIEKFKVDYYLSKGNDGRSILKTVEKITARFPDSDQNHGIDRQLFKTYDNHSTNLKVISITDEAGSPIEYTTPKNKKHPNVLYLKIGNQDIFVHGLKTYVITYTQRDVTKYFSNTNDDEFYWDTNGTEWKQLFKNVSATVHLDSSVANDFNKNAECYFGKEGEKHKCITKYFDNGAILFTTLSSLKSYENMTIVVGFKPHTFTEYQKTSGEIIKEYVRNYITGMNLLVLIIIIALRLVKTRNAPSRSAIVAEFLPPKDIDVATAAMIVKKPKKWFAATCIDFAVRRNIKLIETQNSANPKKPEYVIEFVSTKGLNENENRIIEAVFGKNPKVGATYKIVKFRQIDKVVRNLCKEFIRLKKCVERGSYYKNLKSVKKWLGILFTSSLVLNVVFYFVIGAYNEPLYFILNGFFMMASAFVFEPIRALSDSGRQMSDYLNGLKQYIRVAEHDRIKILQSPRGAQKALVDINDTKYLIHLYERLLPYAILFGEEKEWATLLGNYYSVEGANPVWFSGNDVSNLTIFSVVSGFSASARSRGAFFGSITSSGLGGSGGGGFSGGGGGGGGGGGW